MPKLESPASFNVCDDGARVCTSSANRTESPQFRRGLRGAVRRAFPILKRLAAGDGEGLAANPGACLPTVVAGWAVRTGPLSEGMCGSGKHGISSI